jgi:hypothetical protein
MKWLGFSSTRRDCNMNRIFGGVIVGGALMISSSAIAQDGGSVSNKAAVVVELEAPAFDDVAKGRASKEQTYYQTGNQRSTTKRGSDALSFCNRINYSSGLVLEYGTIITENTQYDYLKRVICFE